MKLLITADWHVRSDLPECRGESFFDTQRKTLVQISNIAYENEATVLIAGDIWHKAKPERSQELEIMLADIFCSILVCFVPGQHDLLYHKIENMNKGSIGVLQRFNNFTFLSNGRLDLDSAHLKFSPYGVPIENVSSKAHLNIIMLHKFIAEKALPEHWNIEGYTAQDLLDKFDYNLFISGDNHHGFVYKKDGRFVINPGCITRQEAGMKNYKPFVVLFDTDTKEYEKIYLIDDNPDDVSTEHLDEIRVRDNRIDKFVDKIKGGVKLDLSFEDNVKKNIEENDIKGGIKEKILIAIGEK